jgi:predicted Co/Zn/Cd cation transporter (cation efflux family)
VIWFGLVSGAVSLAVWAYARRRARRIESSLIEADARDWLIDFGFSLPDPKSSLGLAPT